LVDASVVGRKADSSSEFCNVEASTRAGIAPIHVCTSSQDRERLVVDVVVVAEAN
jgi:hypothetical protein